MSKDKRLDIRVSWDDHARFVELAEAMGLTVSQAIRFVMLEKHREIVGGREKGKRR